MDKKITSHGLLRYPGGKHRARKILYDYMPADVNRVLSPFFGGGSFELFLTDKNMVIDGVDNFYVLSNFWERTLKEPEQVADYAQRWVGKIDSNSFKEMQTVLTEYDKEKKIPTDERNEVAALFFIVNRCSFSGATLSGGFSKESSRTRFNVNAVERLRLFYNPSLKVSYANALDVLNCVSDDTDFLFLDPPYLLEGDKNKLYGIQGDQHKTFDHYILYERVSKSTKRFLLTYNNSDEIRDLWKDYTISDATWSYGMNKTKKSSEIIIRNY